jgi:hypothetical protein
MRNDKILIKSIVCLSIGAVLFGLGFAEVLDSFWSGMGGSLIAVGVVRMIQILRYGKDEVYREKVQIERADERNQFIRNKAWAWSGYLFVLITAISTIVCKLVGQELLSMASGFAVCIFVVLYWLCYLVLRKKY